jgi:hypothetical protein
VIEKDGTPQRRRAQRVVERHVHLTGQTGRVHLVERDAHHPSRSSGTTPNNRPMFNSPKNRTTFASGSGLKTMRFVNTVRRMSRATFE